MKTLKERRLAALKAANEILAAKSADGFTDEQRSQLQGHLDEVKALDLQIATAAADEDLVKGLNAAAKTEDGAPPKKAEKSFGQAFMEAKAAKGGPGLQAGISTPEMKAAADTHVIGNPAYLAQRERADRPLIQAAVADLLEWGPISGTGVSYPEFGPVEGATSEVTEAGQKPQIHQIVTERNDPLGEVAGWLAISDNMLEDDAYMASEIDTTLINDLTLRQDNTLLNGTGSIKGILQRSGIQTEASASAADNVRAIRRAKTKVKVLTGHAADGIVINPVDYEALALTQDNNGQYYAGGPFYAPYGNGDVQFSPSLWATRTVESSQIAAKTVLVGAFRVGAKAYAKGGIRIESTNSHADYFTNDKTAIRGLRRVALKVSMPTAFCRVTLL